MGGRRGRHPNELDEFYAGLPEAERQRLSESYMTLVDYWVIHGSDF